jgi:hypothetical protein
MSLWQRVLDGALGLFSSDAPAGNPIKARGGQERLQGGLDIGIGKVLPIGDDVRAPLAEGRPIKTPWGPATIYEPDDPRYQMELDRLFESIDQQDERFEPQRTGRDIGQLGVARFAVGAYMRQATSKAAGAKIGQHDPVQKAQEGLRRNIIPAAQLETPETREAIIQRLGKLPRGAQPLADPTVAGLLGRKPKGII